MRKPSGALVLVLALAGLATASAVDLHRVETQTLVVYTTPALQDFLEKSAIPRFEAATGIHVLPVYMSAGDEYYRVRLSVDRPEADVFVHASPLFIEKGFPLRLFSPLAPLPNEPGADFQSREVPGGRVWYAFAWSPLVEVYHPRFDAAPDVATADVRIGFPHPLLSNNGIYNVLFFELLDPAAGQRAIAHTVVQPTNARATIGGVADGSYDLTIGYEAVAALYKQKGAKVSYEAPLFKGERVTSPVLFSAGIVQHHVHAGAAEFVESLFGPEVQASLATYYLRPLDPNATQPKGTVDLNEVRTLHYDWADWQSLEQALPKYEVNK